MSSPGDELWTPIRRATLTAISRHILPIDPSRSHADAISEAGARYVRRALSAPPFEAREPWVLALLDEIEARAEALSETGLEAWDSNGVGFFPGLEPAMRETLLRQLEADESPYLAQAVRMVLELGLEGYFGEPERGGNPDGSSWQDLGLTDRGQRRRLGPPKPPASEPLPRFSRSEDQAGSLDLGPRQDPPDGG